MVITKVFNDAFLNFPSRKMAVVRGHAYSIFAVVPGAAHSVPHAALPALSASQTDLYTSDAGCPAAGAGAVLVRAALLIFSARVGLVVVKSLVLVPALIENSRRHTDSRARLPPSTTQRWGQVLDRVGIDEN